MRLGLKLTCKPEKKKITSTRKIHDGAPIQAWPPKKNMLQKDSQKLTATSLHYVKKFIQLVNFSYNGYPIPTSEPMSKTEVSMIERENYGNGGEKRNFMPRLPEVVTFLEVAD